MVPTGEHSVAALLTMLTMCLMEVMLSPLASLVVHLKDAVIALAISQPLAQKPRMSSLLCNRECAHSWHQL